MQAKALKTLNDHNDNFMQREVWEGDNANYSRFQSALELNETMDGYFKEKLHINPQRMFEELNIDLANKIIHLNNFFIKKDITNANNVLQFSKVNGATEILIVDGSEVDHRDKQSVFETG
ncbi:MAG: hypothetical protein LBH96_00030 [Candidatus Peribacteria bacterium]|nr:hypothetical protein [Candidatus Peribacteria bacterium]